jgi:hypothetical protein
MGSAAPLLILVLALGCDQAATSGNSGIPEESRQKITKEQVVRFAQEINTRGALKPPLDTQIETHFQLARQVLSDDALLSIFHKPQTIKRRVLLEYHDTISVNGMLQTNCSYELDDCEMVIHLTLLPSNDAKVAQHMREAHTNKDVVRSEKSGGKDIYIGKGVGHTGGGVFGEKLFVTFFARKPGGEPADFGVNEAQLWTVLQSVASRVE